MGPVNIFMLWLILLSVSTCLLVFGIFYLWNKEKMAMIERGIQPRAKAKNQPMPFTSLKIGALFTGTGLGILLAYLIHTIGFNSEAMSDIYPMYFAMLFAGGGAGFLFSYKLEMRYWNKNNDMEESEV
jgi:hypothetical protein